jgi:hypothetical protein
VSEVTQDDQEPTGWIRWPIWVLAVVVVLPFRLLWELLEVVARFLGRFLGRYVGRPLAWLWRHAIVMPVSLVWRYAVVPLFRLLWELLRVVAEFLSRYVGRPLAWLWRRLVEAPLAWLGRRITNAVDWAIRVGAPLWRLLGETLALLARGIIWLVIGFVRWVLLPGWRGTGWIGRQVYLWLLRPVYRRLLRPVGVAVARVWRRTVTPCGRIVGKAARWLRESVLRPTADAARNVLMSFGRYRGP